VLLLVHAEVNLNPVWQQKQQQWALQLQLHQQPLMAGAQLCSLMADAAQTISDS
jgi:hypothetical protein